MVAGEPNAEIEIRPLAERMRPRGLGELIGQGHLLGSGKPLQRAIAAGRLHSMIFWGPPGSGKTTLARLIANQAQAHFLRLSAVMAGVKDIRDAVTEAREVLAQRNLRTLLFIDEVHRFNKGQQDALLPHVENGTLVFIGATTENPSFEVNNALLSRARVYVLKPLSLPELERVIELALSDEERGLGERRLLLDQSQRLLLAQAADGDARRALNLLEQAADLTESGAIPMDLVQELVAGGYRRFDKGGELFYDQISALHKSLRGSAPDAALYWLARLLDGGMDPEYVARRLVRMASEDVGNADPRALGLALEAWEVQQRLGSPEGELALAQVVLYLACAPKSNAVYLAWKAALEDAKGSGSLEVPLHLRNAPTRLMGQLGYGKGYRYAHDEPGAYAAGETYLPPELIGRSYYHPVERGLEIRIREKLAHLCELDRAASHRPPAMASPDKTP